jgi:KDO2-lipid IV(A) lauroyltransferase
MARLTWWKRTRHRLEFVAAATLLRLCERLSPSARRRVGADLGWLAYRVVGVRRNVVLDNLRTAFPDRDAKALDTIALHSYMNFGRSAMEAAAMRVLTPQEVLAAVSIDGREVIDDALRYGKGAILFTGHFGNWELLGAALGQSGYPLYVTDTRHSNPAVHRLINELRETQKVNVLTPREPIKRLFRLLESNRFIAYLSDQDARGNGVFVDFFGKPASTFRGPAILAIRSGCPVLTGVIVREEGGRHRVIIEPTLWPDPHLSGDAAVIDLTQRFTRRLEAFVRRYPEQYFWFHRRWKSKPPPSAAA